MKIKFFANYASSEQLTNRFKNNYIITDDSINFTTGEDYELAVVFNKTDTVIKPGIKVITIIQEPSFSPVHIGNKFLTDSDVLVVHDKCLFEKTLKIKLGKTVVELPSFMWFNDHVDKSYFDNSDKVKKRKKLSYIVSSIYMSVGIYRKRIELLNKIIKSDLDIDIYGRGLQLDDSRYKGELDYKFIGLMPYEYTIAVENSSENNYVSEKFIDPVLCNTTPIYLGAPNIDNVYETNSFIDLNIDSSSVIEDLKNVSNTIRGKYHLEALAESKKRYFHDYNLYSLIKNLCLRYQLV